jgi:uncharacterized protein YgbK (DUF1537 family)
LQRDGAGLAIADAISDDDLYTLGEACANDLLLTGGSGLALGLPRNFERAGLLPAAQNSEQVPGVKGLSAVLSGSCSRATQAQVAHWRDSGRPAFRVDPLALARGDKVVDEAMAFVQPLLAKGPVLVYATSSPEEVGAVQKQIGTAASGELVEQALAAIARRMHDAGVRRFVVAGGETSGAVVNALDVKALQIGPQIDPGVPATVSIGATPLALALKSGNFGTVDFFSKTLGMFDQLAGAQQ